MSAHKIVCEVVEGSEKPTFASSFRYEGFTWTVCGTFVNLDSYIPGLDNVEMACKLDSGSETTLWQCDAMIGLAILGAEEEPKHSMMCIRGFCNGESTSSRLTLPSKGPSPSEKSFLPLKNRIEIEVTLELHSKKLIDLSRKDNEVLFGPEDAVLCVVGGKDLWLSKKILSVHSIVFATMFRNKFGEEATAVHRIDDIPLDHFLDFLANLYKISTVITDHSVRYLVDLTEMFKCDFVKNRCHEFLRSACSSKISMEEKICLADTLKMTKLLNESVQKSPQKILQKFIQGGSQKDISPLATDLIYDCLAYM
ncbi:hypothetical protein L596_024006 [Steinernema carpocapsae]|uniref:BTB domain-containing protein n=1 Tax=Steinernema carpocapsae TaxID=34508 RepID=A0A4U5MFE3_STECR|nr:hypothetical protein L596_024006 [Steinernema carpocapsae]